MEIFHEEDRLQAAIAAVIDENREWLGAVMQALLYPENSQKDLFVPAGPERLKEMDKEDALVDLPGAHELHTNLLKAADLMIEAAKKGEKPPQEVLAGFFDLFDEFSLQMRRLQKDYLEVDFGVDPLTGLRSRRVMEKDLAREMERQARRGKPFCLVLAQIDDFADFVPELPRKQQQELLRVIGEIAKKCLRSFDDAYYLGDGDFLLALKQTGSSGGFSAIDRLKMYLAETPFAEKELPVVSMSFCAAEPIPGDNINEMLKFMRADLSHHDKEGGGMALEYNEQSPLERFLKSGELQENEA